MNDYYNSWFAFADVGENAILREIKNVVDDINDLSTALDLGKFVGSEIKDNLYFIKYKNFTLKYDFCTKKLTWKRNDNPLIEFPIALWEKTFQSSEPKNEHKPEPKKEYKYVTTYKSKPILCQETGNYMYLETGRYEWVEEDANKKEE